MILSDFLTLDRVVLPLVAETLQDAVADLLDRMGDALPASVDRDRLARDAVSGDRGELVRLNDQVVVALVLQEGLAATEAAVGVAPEPFTVPDEGRDGSTHARALFVFVRPRRLSAFRGQAIPALGRWVRETGNTTALLDAVSPREMLALPGLGEVNLAERMRVEAAVTPVTYRIYPDTPLHEVLEFMVRRELRALPVVGTSYEVLGIITAGDILATLLPRRRGRDQEAGDASADTEGLTARDVMTRTVLCVSEEQSLMEAASVMVNRDVGQLPVVREGELVGFLTREAALRALYGDT